MLIRVDQNSSMAMHDQIAGQLRAAIADGQVTAGQRLPPARELANSLGVNMHTVLRAVQTLRGEGLLEVRRGRGITVTGTAPRLAALGGLADRLIAEARQRGLSDPEIRAIVEGAL